MTICGITYMGAVCKDDGQELGLHRRASNIPAADVCIKKEWIDDEFTIKVSGKLTESSLYGENITSIKRYNN